MQWYFAVFSWLCIRNISFAHFSMSWSCISRNAWTCERIFAGGNRYRHSSLMKALRENLQNSNNFKILSFEDLRLMIVTIQSCCIILLWYYQLLPSVFAWRALGRYSPLAADPDSFSFFLQMDLQQAKNVINLNVLKRYDSSIIHIIETSSHVVLYDFDTHSSQWKKRGIEGTLFLYERSQEPRFGFYILNRSISLTQELD